MVPAGYPLPQARATMAELERALMEVRMVQRVDFGIYVEDLHSGLRVDIGASQHYAVAGMDQLPISLYVFAHAALGALDLSTLVEYLPQDRTGGPGVVHRMPFGRRFTLRELCQHAILDHDRTALRMLERSVGKARVEAWLSALTGAAADSVTPAAYAHYYKRLLNLVDERPGYGGLLLQWVKQSGAPYGLAKYLPNSVPVAHNSGAGVTAVGDAGIVFRLRAPYLVSVMANLSAERPAGPVMEQIAEIGALVNRHVSKLEAMFANVLLNGKQIDFGLPACLVGDDVIVPLDGLSNALGAQVQVDRCTQSVTIRLHGRSLDLSMSETYEFEKYRLVPLLTVARGLGIACERDFTRNRVLLDQ